MGVDLGPAVQTPNTVFTLPCSSTVVVWPELDGGGSQFGHDMGSPMGGSRLAESSCKALQAFRCYEACLELVEFSSLLGSSSGACHTRTLIGTSVKPSQKHVFSTPSSSKDPY